MECAVLQTPCSRAFTARRPHRLTVRSAAAEGAGPAAPQTLRLTLRKPLGLVLAERPGPPVQVFIEEITAGGNAAKDGRLKVGDVLVGCSATLLKTGKEGEFEREGYGARVMFDARGKQFDTVMAALGSNSERWGIFDVELEVERAAQ
ncbi:fatty acid-binding adipocyte [Micractinium conductrix]|uniref:Fatty acid-binding adipocyte n=1 Tax=Micractinium conductrix TaxID=554055 RepID=A0A2P6VHD6_9CHLO|nr:fatty acid-binding adipocyte [Micractinium conductrix]|eukprot:PSC73495.1 fatty acid-binding adipocyte [Micractinium conductrix]